jgi:peptidoglycan/xylan/chitin deacetylase (PgdA/CDA1 family)
MFCHAAAAAVLLLFGPAHLFAASSARTPALSFDRGRRDLPKLALTFDGGSDVGESLRILDVLRYRGVIATFFLTEGYIRNNPALVLRIAADGHEVGNHTSTHPHLTSWNRNRRHDTLPGIDEAFVDRELSGPAQAFRSVTGLAMAPLWRAPFGEINGELLELAQRAGWSHVGWTRDDRGGRHTLDSLDWVDERASRNYLSSAQIGARIRTFGAGGSGLSGGIVLMHLSTRREDPHVTRLGELIDALRGDGYRLVTVGELRRDAAPGAGAGPLTAALRAFGGSGLRP